MKGRDVLIGIAIGAFLVLFLMNYHSGKSSPPHPRPSSSQSAKATNNKGHNTHQGAGKQHTTAAHRTTASRTTAHQATTHQATAAKGTPATDALPSSHRLATGKNASKTDAKTTASAPGKSSGISDSLIVIACLIAIAAALSTVTLTVRGLRADK